MTDGTGERATRNDVLAVYAPKQGSVKSAVIVITLLVLWGMFRVPGLLHGARAFSLGATLRFANPESLQRAVRSTVRPAEKLIRKEQNGAPSSR